MDVDSIKPGIDFVQTIEERVSACDVLVAVIGKRWLSAADGEGRRRLDNPEDFVRVEVGTALKRNVRVIPVLVEGALMPPAGQLPEELKPLARRNALNVSHDRFRADSERLIDSVGEVLEAARVELPREREERQPARGPRQNETEALPGIGAGPSAPASKRTPLKGVTANLKRPRRLLVVMGLGVVVVVCLLGFGLFKATRPQPVSIGGSSSPTPAPLAASNTPSPTPLVSQASPSPSLSAADWFAEAKRYLDVKAYVQALPPLQKAAAAGNAEAMNALGWLYENGRGVTQDYAQAREWFQKAAGAGNTEALEHLGFLYEHGDGVAQNYATAREYYQKAAGAGNTEALEHLGFLYEHGDGVAQNYATAREYYQKAAESGNALAMTNLGFLYQNGWGVTQDYAQARQWFQRAADAGDAKAKQALLRLPSNIPTSSPSPISQPLPSPSPSGADWSAEAKRYLDAKDYAMAFPLLQKAADAGDADAMDNLAWLYRNGLGTKEDDARAGEWYQKAAAAGNVNAMDNLGWLYENGVGVTRDYAKAREWYAKAADAGNADAKQALLRLPSKQVRNFPGFAPFRKRSVPVLRFFAG
jgi:TPR repeat protein